MEQKKMSAIEQRVVSDNVGGGVLAHAIGGSIAMAETKSMLMPSWGLNLYKRLS